MAAFKVGDVVQLKSGGPKMTVRKTEPISGIQTSWFAGSKHESGWFPPDALMPAADKEKP